MQPIDLDGCGKLTICANVEPQNEAYEPGYHTSPELGVSWYSLDRETSRKLYSLKRFYKAFSEELSNEFENYVANIIMDILVEIDHMQGGKIALQSGVMTFWSGCGSAGARRKSCLKILETASRQKV